MGIKCQGQLIFTRPKAKTDSTSYLIDVVWGGHFGTILLTLLMTAYVKGHERKEEKAEIDID